MIPAFPVVDPRFPATSGWGADRPATAKNHGAHKHEGLDFATPKGSPVFALDSGVVVVSTKVETVEGNWIAILHSWGVSRYMHLDERLVEKGSRVSSSQPIALSGDTGVTRSGPHLHFDLAIKLELEPEYVRLFGTPKGGFGKVRTYAGVKVVSVPAEPLVPANLSERVVASAAARGVKKRSAVGETIVSTVLGAMI